MIQNNEGAASNQSLQRNWRAVPASSPLNSIVRPKQLMAISKKNSRRINIDDHVYRWSAFKDSGFIVVVVQHERANGRKLEIVVSNDENVIIEKGSYSIEYGERKGAIITPKIVSNLVTRSIKLGWDPHKKGPTAELSLDGNELSVRRGL